SELFSSGYGTSVAGVGDVNGDGYGDIVVGAPLYDAFGFFDEGRAFLYPGSASGPATSPAWTADGNKNLAQFGQSVAAAGDVNRDGFADVIIGAPTYDTGRVTLYQGAAAGLEARSAFPRSDTQANQCLGGLGAAAGGGNGEGFADFPGGAHRLEKARGGMAKSGGGGALPRVSKPPDNDAEGRRGERRPRPLKGGPRP